MSRIIMISDIHGCIKPFNQMLDFIKFNPNKDKLILLGDYVDRGPNSKDVVDKVISLVKEYGAIALRGNHDQRLVDLISNHDNSIQTKFIEHGGIETIHSYCDAKNEINEIDMNKAISIISENYSHHIDFLRCLPLYYEDDKHLYVHAGINPKYSNWKEQSDYEFMYIKDEFLYYPTSLDKKVVFGHTKVIDIHGKADVWFSEDKIGIDGGCAFGLQLNGLIYENGTYETISIVNRSNIE
ncbi:metallophosphoesterase family protein [Paenibacillus endoradicis]|uniref:metallophosphoesterase family protein n=1 Tax=Paenibacillus endoradicis TaxID=2972487 RepID=UPI0021595AD9|nr:metallophosphoesterase family protein [Paenibacillus endoradicis]MCR8657384.1 serine/threonine protein phosphatase [Paenibacillus endoradicis]